MKEKNVTEVLIDGRKYTLGGFEDDAYLQRVASYINKKITEFKKTDFYRGLDIEQKKILLAINIADDYYKEQKKAKEFRKESELKDQSVVEMKNEIIALQDKLKEAESKQKELETSLEKSEKKIVELETKLKHRR